jgi:hypothetical protein
MSGDDPELARDRRLMALRWLAVGREDPRVARLCLDAVEPALSASAYHCQQAAEKLIKGLLVLGSMPFARTHDLRTLARWQPRDIHETKTCSWRLPCSQPGHSTSDTPAPRSRMILPRSS